MNEEEEMNRMNELQKEIQERYEKMLEDGWMCVFCEKIFKGIPKYFLDFDEPLCGDCYKQL